ncbi:class IV adenylate cyclase [Candidatus Woesearchaeota archaeon]|nr:class IV adenylate cyclase [Candidatus Woesearchaeota archaeon]
MKEIEVKVLEINQQEIIKRLESLGAKRILSNALIEDCRFDFRDNLLKKKKELLRLRKIEKDAYLTYKNNYSVQNNVRNQDEFETKVGDSEQMKNILLGLGLQVKSIRQKRRTSYLYQDIRIEIDNFPKIPVFLEIEAPSEQKIRQMLEILDIPLEKAIPLTSGEVLKKYCKDDKHLIFPNSNT